MSSIHTHPTIITCIMSRMRTWHNQETNEEPTGLPPLITQSLADQDAIGWSNFISGIWSSKWTEAQQSYYIWLQKKRTGKRWAVSIIKLLINIAWDMWSHRNGLRHLPSNKRVQKATSLLDEAIREEMSRGCLLLPPSVHHYFSEDLPSLLARPLHYKRNWLSTIDTARQLEIDGAIVTTDRTPLRRWLETGFFLCG